MAVGRVSPSAGGVHMFSLTNHCGGGLPELLRDENGVFSHRLHLSSCETESHSRRLWRVLFSAMRFFCCLGGAFED